MQKIFVEIKLLIACLSFSFLGCMYNTKTKFETGKRLSDYYTLDRIDSIEIQNWKGVHILSVQQVDSVIQILKGCVCIREKATIKPGHLTMQIFFKDKTSLGIYMNSNSEIIVSPTAVDDYTFLPEQKVNWENF